jgi:hypothetical protein
MGVSPTLLDGLAELEPFGPLDLDMEVHALADDVGGRTGLAAVLRGPTAEHPEPVELLHDLTLASGALPALHSSHDHHLSSGCQAEMYVARSISATYFPPFSL